MVFDKKKYKEMVEDLKGSGKYIKREKTAQERISSKVKKLKSPTFPKKMTYKSGSPLKGLLKTKQSTVRVSGVKEKVNLMRAEW